MSQVGCYSLIYNDSEHGLFNHISEKLNIYFFSIYKY